MNGKNVAGIILMVLSGLVLAAAILLIALQWGNHCNVTMYGPSVRVNTALLMLCSAAGGVVMVVMGKIFLYGLRNVLRERKRKRDLAKAVQSAQASAQPAADPGAGPAKDA